MTSWITTTLSSDDRELTLRYLGIADNGHYRYEIVDEALTIYLSASDLSDDLRIQKKIKRALSANQLM